LSVNGGLNKERRISETPEVERTRKGDVDAI